ncbi:PA14 domain-containing protein, partial [Candidatus Albibeggiatoa sp. nov. NOAA]|uniref:PA14 domain-containing protein n=1 Tax=Candidatus Albibeggiatoa sp. nov. NOAA TaxID=3162724 RepID=UPI0032F80E84|nr:PA14 domain-containing protein [Thiotrichaceae bacterium]
YNALPEFNKLPLYATGTVDQLYFPRLNGKSFGGPIDNGAASFAGKLYVDVAGSYKFYTVSDDGSKLYINGNAVVANGGNHGMRERSGALSLTAGFHDIKIDYYDAGGPGGIKMFWEGPNFTRQVIPASVLMHSQDDYDEAFDAIDQDGDGLTDKLEDAYGSDKTKVDSNGDGLTDFERYSLGLDAMTIDT